MLTYWILLLGLTGSGILLCRDKRGNLIYCVIAGIVLFITAAVRRSVGYDYNLYAGWYLDAGWLMDDEVMAMKQEKGFMMPVKMLADMTDNYQIMFAAIAFIITAGLMIFLYKNSERPWAGVFCFLTFGVFFNSMNFMRQMIASVILLMTLRYIREKKFFSFLIMVIFASTFHVSSLIFIPFYFILRIRMNRVTLTMFSAVSVVLFIFSYDILEFTTAYVYKGYAGESREALNGTPPVYTIFFGLFFLAAFVVRKELSEKDPFNNVLLNCLFFVVFFEFMGNHHGILSRFSVLFIIPAFTLLIPRAIELLAEKVGRWAEKRGRKPMLPKAAVISAAVLMCCGMYTYMISVGYNGVTPYQTVFSDPLPTEQPDDEDDDEWFEEEFSDEEWDAVWEDDLEDWDDEEALSYAE